MTDSAALTRVRLRYRDRTLNLPPGRYLLGRGPTCHIVLDDPRVSRTHAQMTVDWAGVAMEDLGSANGIWLNGARIHGSVRLNDGDFVVIGDQELAFELSTPAPRAQADTQPEQVPGEPDFDAVVDGVAELSTAKSSALDLLGGVAERAMAAGDPGQAETIIHARLAEVLDQLRAGQPVEPAVVQRALRIALDLAIQLKARRWLDYALDLLTARGQPCPPLLAIQMRAARTAAGAPDPTRLAAYMRRVRALPTSLEKVRTVALLDDLA